MPAIARLTAAWLGTGPVTLGRRAGVSVRTGIVRVCRALPSRTALGGRPKALEQLGQVSEGWRSGGKVGSTSATSPQRGQTRRGNCARST